MKKEIEKGIIRLVCRICATLLVPLSVIPVCITLEPARFLDEEAAYYLENKDFESENDGKIRVLIAGDSCGKADWVPELLGGDVYNYSLGGAGPIEEYYALKNYLKKNEAPEYLIYTMSSWYFTMKSALWGRSVYFHRLSAEDMFDLHRTANQYEDVSALGTEHVLADYLGYALYLPKHYGKAFFEGLFSNERLKGNTAGYQYARSGKGHVLYGREASCNEVTPFVADHFERKDILVGYLYRTIELCEANGVKFVFQPPPLNPSSHAAMASSDYLDEYSSFLESVQEKYPAASIDAGVPAYDADSFGDVHHLNGYGAETFTGQMAKKYDYIFE